jgi:hypothetical protein
MTKYEEDIEMFGKENMGKFILAYAGILILTVAFISGIIYLLYLISTL